jgi:curved DNA-binding protein CbpA
MTSQQPKDLYYRRLQVGQDASHDEIVQAYRHLAHGVHPDTHPGDPEPSKRFREITEAYEVLRSTARRASYDRDQGSSAGRTVRVVLRDATEPSWGTGEVPRNPGGEEPPVVLGASHWVAGNAPLRAGPVRIEGHGEDRPSSGETSGGGLWRVFSDMLDSFGRQ